MNERTDSQVWAEIDRRLGEVERFIPTQAVWRADADPPSAASVHVVADRRARRTTASSHRAARRLALALLIVGLVVGLVGAMILVGGRQRTLPSDVRTTGSMTIGRIRQSATLLTDGHVLIVGGDDPHGNAGPSSPSTAELYDPVTGTFIATGSLAAVAIPVVATPLGDGRVLVLRTDGSADLYDPVTGRFAATGSMSVARTGPSTTLLADGRILVAGGGTRGGGPGSVGMTSAELYDPGTGRFSLTGSMTTPRRGPDATLLNDGRVLVVGSGTPGGSGPSAELYDPRTGRFTPTGNLVTPVDGTTVVRLRDGRVLLVGGSMPGTASEISAAELFDPATGTFGDVGWLRHPEIFVHATLLLDGRVLISGAGNAGPFSMELFDPGSATFSEIQGRATSPMWSSATLLADGDVLIAGGLANTGAILADAFLVDGHVPTASAAP